MELIDLSIDAIGAGKWDQEKLYAEIGRYYMNMAPASIYKYYSPDDRNIENIENNKMWYSAACNFNDPFDMEMYFDENAMFESLLNTIPEAKGIREGSPVWIKVRGEFEKEFKIFRKQIDVVRNTTAISCFSEKCDSILMWSHYAKNHTGFCVEYELLEFVNKIKFTPIPIIYDEQKMCMNRLDMNNLGPDSLRVLVYAITRKALEWKYECEWRIARSSSACGSKWEEANKGALLEAIKPKSVIIGCDTTKLIADRLKKYCKEQKITMYRMEKDNKEYKLNKLKVR